MRYGVLQDFYFEGIKYIEGQEINENRYSTDEFNTMIAHGKVVPILDFVFKDPATGSVTFDGEDIIVKNVENYKEDKIEETEVEEDKIEETEVEEDKIEETEVEEIEEVKVVEADNKQTTAKRKRGKRN